MPWPYVKISKMLGVSEVQASTKKQARDTHTIVNKRFIHLLSFD